MSPRKSLADCRCVHIQLGQHCRLGVIACESGSNPCPLADAATRKDAASCLIRIIPQTRQTTPMHGAPDSQLQNEHRAATTAAQEAQRLTDQSSGPTLIQTSDSGGCYAPDPTGPLHNHTCCLHPRQSCFSRIDDLDRFSANLFSPETHSSSTSHKLLCGSRAPFLVDLVPDSAHIGPQFINRSKASDRSFDSRLSIAKVTVPARRSSPLTAEFTNCHSERSFVGVPCIYRPATATTFRDSGVEP
nr:hypothetical protein CFP56_67644 [Quercus suber]